MINSSIFTQILSEAIDRLESGTEIYDGKMTLAEYCAQTDRLTSARAQLEEIEKSLEELEELRAKIGKIEGVVTLALVSEDPINLYKARAIDEISKILTDGKIEPAEDPCFEDPADDQMTIDDFINGEEG